MNSQDIARYIEETDGISKPWLLLQLRLKKLEERRTQLLPETYYNELEEIRQELINLEQWKRKAICKPRT